MKRAKTRLAVAVLAVILLSAVFLGRALAYRAMPVEVECPVDGTRVESWEIASWTLFCMRLDLKPLGAMPAPPPIHECPNDGFVWHREVLTETEIESVRSWIRSESYRELRSESPYFRLARIYERAGRRSLEIAHAFLKASWEVEANPERYRKYLAESHARLTRHLGEAAVSSGAPGSNEHASQQILAGELERQLGDFDAAEARFKKLREDTAATTTPTEKKIVAYELQLVSRRDSAPQYVPGEDVDEDRCRNYDRKQGKY